MTYETYLPVAVDFPACRTRLTKKMLIYNSTVWCKFSSFWTFFFRWVLWLSAPCMFVCRHQNFKEICYCHLHGWQLFPVTWRGGEDKSIIEVDFKAYGQTMGWQGAGRCWSMSTGTMKW